MYYQYATDEMGSITHIVDDKEILNYYEYDAWVNIVEQKETVKNRFKFNGQQLAPITQQYYLRARFYNPVIARFTQEDTYREDGLNLYTYCRNNPIYRVEAIKSISYIKLFAIFSLNSKNGLSSKLYRKMSLVEYHKILKINQLQLQIKGSGSSKWLLQSLDKVK
ncbi:MAG: RHS repeat-associated core domain-containing protein [Eubacteriales bacterium]|nr:RHS repeat-associated core domain-containing protein [Eubacteriales bacterium]